MKYLWTEDTGAGLHFWELVNSFVFNNQLLVESKVNNQQLLDAVSKIQLNATDKYYIVFDYVMDNQDIRNKYRLLKAIADKSNGSIIILDILCFEYLILSFDKLVAWTGCNKKDKILIYDEIMAAVDSHRIDLSKIQNKKVIDYISGFKRFSTEKIMKSLANEITSNEKWSVKGNKMGECWYKDCCVSEYQNSLRCGKPTVTIGDEKFEELIHSNVIQNILNTIIKDTTINDLLETFNMFSKPGDETHKL